MPKNKQDLIPIRLLSTDEEASIALSQQKATNNPKRFFKGSKGKSNVKITPLLDENLPKGDAVALFLAQISKASGSSNVVVGEHILQSATNAALAPCSDKNAVVKHANAVVSTMHALAPQDEVEGHLIAQMVVLQEHAMCWLKKAMKTDRVDFTNSYINGASKLLTRHHEALDALVRYRRRGEQRVHVEHVHVYEGGKAIVGMVAAGGGDNQKSEEGPHAKV